MFLDGSGIMFFMFSKQGKNPKLDELVKSHFEEYLADFFSEACEGHYTSPGLAYISELSSCSAPVRAALTEGWDGLCSLILLKHFILLIYFVISIQNLGASFIC